MRLASPSRTERLARPLVETGKHLFDWPDTLLEKMALYARHALPQGGDVSADKASEAGLTQRLTGLEIAPRSERVLLEFLESYKERNLRYFGSFGEAEVYVPAFAEELQDVVLEDLAREQSKMAWDALRDTYFSRYRVRSDRTLRHNAWQFASWRGMDFLVLPPLMALYLYYRGVDRTFTFTGTELRVTFDPLSTWIQDDDPKPELSAVWAPFSRAPAELIGVATFELDGVDLSFVGVGTSLSEVRKALSLQEDP